MTMGTTMPAGPAPGDHAAMEAELTELNHLIAELEQRRDAAAVRRLDGLVAPDLVFRRANGAVVGKPGFLAGLDGPSPLGEARDGDLADAIEQALAGRRRDEVADALFDAGVPAAPVHRGEEAVRQDWLWDDGFYELKAHPQWGELVTSKGYASFAGADASFAALHPELGEHTVAVLRDYGVPDDRIAALAKAGVIFRR